MNGQTMLVVDDNPDHLELTATTLQEQGGQARIVLASNGEAALDYLFGQGSHVGRDIRSQPAVVLLDLKLLGLSGLDVLRRIRARPATALIPVVMLTSSSERSDMLAAYREGANAYVCKPVNFDEFTRKLQALKAFWLGVNEVVTTA